MNTACRIFSVVALLAFISASAYASQFSIVPFSQIYVNKSVLPKNPPAPLPGSTHAKILISDLVPNPSRPSDVEYIGFLFPHVEDVVIQGMAISLVSSGRMVPLGIATQVQPFPYGGVYTVPASSDLRLTYAEIDSNGRCPDREGGRGSHSCVVRRALFTLSNRAQTLVLKCVRIAEVTSTGSMPFYGQEPSGLPNCEIWPG